MARARKKELQKGTVPLQEGAKATASDKGTVPGASAAVRKGFARGVGILTLKNLLILLAMLAAFGIVQLLSYLGWVTPVYESVLATICIFIILAVSLNLITGFTGQFSLGHAGFMAVGAYTCAIIVSYYPTTAGFLLGMLAGGVLAMIFGILIGFPTLRLKGDYLAIATLGMAEIIRVVVQNLTITGGASGLFSNSHMATWPWLFFFMAVSILVINNFIKSSRGRACIAVREDEIAAESMGINSTKYKVMAFAIGAFFAGIGGGLYASYFFVIKPVTFGFLMSINILVMVVFGGLGSISGSVVSAVLLTLLTNFFTIAPPLNVFGLFTIDWSRVNMIIYALLLIIIMLFRPQGLMGTMEVGDLFKKRPGRGRRRRGATPEQVE
ncbi:MAG: branched-chain amino acid ABC transporter permease [Coriobacteriia bacterium]|nr:branched-chain amino acid ABC transporter permease [Coriobacteriia bacterium]